MADLPRIIGRFKLVEEIGRGGMGVVYLARQTDLDRDVAIKELPSFHAGDATFVARFLRESRIAGSLSHPNIVTVHDYFEHDGAPYIAMEYVERGSLRPLMHDLSLAQIAGVLEGLLAGLAHAEARGIVHRDLKPENLMVSGGGSIKIADFGIAKAFNSAAATSGYATRTGTTVGTPAYMAPEQAMAREIGPWTDLYSTGIIAYELMTGRVPFYDTETPVVVLMRQVNDEPPPPQSLNPSLDPALCDWVGRMLQKAPADRYQGAAEAWDALEEIVIGLLGARWRREARLVERAPSPEVEAATPEPLTPAEFVSEVDDGFVTVDPRGRAADEPTPPSTPVPVPPPEPAVEAEVETPPEAEAVPEPEAEGPSGFITVDPRGRAGAPPPPPVTPPEAEAVPEPGPEPTPPPEPEPILDAGPGPQPERASTESPPPPVVPVLETPTVPPTSRHDTEPELERPGRRRGLLVAAALGLLVVAGIVAAFALSGGGDGSSEAASSTTASSSPSSLGASLPDTSIVDSTAEETAPTESTAQPTESTAASEPIESTGTGTGPLAADPAVPPSDRVALAASGGSLFVADPYGRVAALSTPGLDPTARLADAAHPRSVAVGAGSIYVADDDTVTRLRPATLAPASSVAFGKAPLLAAGEGGTLAAVATIGDRGRLCLVQGDALDPCVALPYAPTGLGADHSTVYVADRERGVVTPYTVSGGGFKAGQPIAVGQGAAGILPVARGTLVVPVKRGLALVDLGTKTVAKVTLPTTPGQVDVAGGRIFAPLPASGQVAIVDLAKPEAEPTYVAAGQQPYAAAAAGDSVYVATGGPRSVVRLDATTGKARPAARLQGFPESAVTPVVLRGVDSAKSGLVTTLTLHLTGGTVPPAALDVTDADVGDGRLTFDLWSGGLGLGFTERDLGTAAVTLAQAPGRVGATIAAPGFESATIALSPAGDAVVVRLTEAPPPPPTNDTGTGTGRTTTTNPPPQSTSGCADCIPG